MIRTVTYDDSTHKIVPIEPSEEWRLKLAKGKCEWDAAFDVIADVIAAAPEYQEPENPLDMPLPCDIRIGAGTIKKGCKLSVLVHRMNVLYQMAMKTQLGISVAVLPDLESRDFYEVMQAYRTAILDAAPQFEAVKQWLRNPTCEYQEPTKNE